MTTTTTTTVTDASEIATIASTYGIDTEASPIFDALMSQLMRAQFDLDSAKRDMRSAASSLHHQTERVEQQIAAGGQPDTAFVMSSATKLVEAQRKYDDAVRNIKQLVFVIGSLADEDDASAVRSEIKSIIFDRA